MQATPSINPDPPLGDVAPFANEVLLPKPDFLRGPWVSSVTALVRNPGAPNPAHLGADYTPMAVHYVLTFGGDGFEHAGRVLGRIKLAPNGTLPAEQAALSGSYTLNRIDDLFQGEITVELPALVDLSETGPLESEFVAPADATLAHRLGFVMRDRDTMDWVILESSDPRFQATVKGTFHRVRQFEAVSLEGTWVMGYDGVIAAPAPPDGIRLGEDFGPGSVLAVMKFAADGTHTGVFTRNLYNRFPADMVNIIGNHTIAANHAIQAFDGTFEVNFNTPEVPRSNFVYFVLRDPDTMDWMLAGSNLTGFAAAITGTLRRAKPIDFEP